MSIQDLYSTNCFFFKFVNLNLLKLKSLSWLWSQFHSLSIFMDSLLEKPFYCHHLLREFAIASMIEDG